LTRELVYTCFMSLDGVVDSPGGKAEGHRSGGWVRKTEFVPEAYSLKAEELTETTALMFGRRSYEAFAPTWRDSNDHVAYKELPKYVVSTSLADDALIEGWGPITILRSVDEIAALKQSDGGAIFIHGSAELARRLSDVEQDGSRDRPKRGADRELDADEGRILRHRRSAAAALGTGHCCVRRALVLPEDQPQGLAGHRGHLGDLLAPARPHGSDPGRIRRTCLEYQSHRSILGVINMCTPKHMLR
jgi:dihydrofolate reductase